MSENIRVKLCILKRTILFQHSDTLTKKLERGNDCTNQTWYEYSADSIWICLGWRVTIWIPICAVWITCRIINQSRQRTAIYVLMEFRYRLIELRKCLQGWCYQPLIPYQRKRKLTKLITNQNVLFKTKWFDH